MNEEKFSGKSEIYMKSRPTYPDEFIKYLYSEAGFDINSNIGDIGAGTGILSKLLALRGSRVICIEPNSDMLNTAKINLAEFSNCIFIKSSAENIDLDDNSVDFITVAQAFHWFDRIKFKAECKRLLKDNGKVVLVWNSRDKSDSLTAESEIINKRFCPEFKGFSGGIKENPNAYADFFRNGFCEFREFKNDLVFNEENFIGRYLSASYAPKENYPNFKEYVDEIKSLFHRHSKSGQVIMQNITRSYLGEV